MKHFRRYIKRITAIDIIVLIFALIFFSFFGRLAYGYEQENWKIDFSEQVAKAYLIHVSDIRKDGTDMGCTLSEQKLDRDIDRILFHFKYQIHKEVKNSSYGEEELDRNAARLNAQRFQD